ncbi:MAG: DUF1592 domain-containing protein [Verrucomicrobiota bacterium]
MKAVRKRLNLIEKRNAQVLSLCAIALVVMIIWNFPLHAAVISPVKQYRDSVQPVLTKFCYDCHADGANKGGVAFDEFKSDNALLENRELWWTVLKYLRAGIMPPEKKPRPTNEEKQTVETWIKTGVFGIDPANLDPGRVTLRRLNRVEYRNTIRELTGVDFNTEGEFPPDDTGHGFDNIGDVLTLPPMLLEKYLAAAKSVVDSAVPTVSKTVAEKMIYGGQFSHAKTNENGQPSASRRNGSLSFYEAGTISSRFKAEHAGSYQTALDVSVVEKFIDGIFDYNKCRLVFKVDGQELLQKEFSWEGGKTYHFELETNWQVGDHQLTFEVQPLTHDEKQTRSLELRVSSVKIRGPMEEKFWVRPKNYERIFPKNVPENLIERRNYAGELLEKFASKAFRHPVDQATITRLAKLAETIYSQPGKTFESGFAQAMTAVLASPRFLFREEEVEPVSAGELHPSVDEYALASRLSYFLWSSMPDAELFRLADQKKLRENLPAQAKRMLADGRSQALMQNFPGQWLQARDIGGVSIDARAVLSREIKVDPALEKLRARSRELRSKDDASLTVAEKEEFEKIRAEIAKSFNRSGAELTGDLRNAMRQETEKVFEHVIRNDLNLAELIDSNWTFLNEPLAKYYGVKGVEGDQMRLVTLPPENPRGGILTQGTVLAVTSNPTRTSPVKRGVFILDNILGMPPPPPPPDIPPLEEAGGEQKDRQLSLREMLELHRSQPLCNSCHSRMDPLGLALENFNALGIWRDKERDQIIDASGKLITGEPFNNIRELKRILANEHRRDFYRCLTEKMLTFALGRGLDYYDVGTVDQIVARIEKENGRPSALLTGIIESVPFQKRRNLPDSVPAPGPVPGQRAEIHSTP